CGDKLVLGPQGVDDVERSVQDEASISADDDKQEQCSEPCDIDADIDISHRNSSIRSHAWSEQEEDDRYGDGPEDSLLIKLEALPQILSESCVGFGRHSDPPSSRTKKEAD